MTPLTRRCLLRRVALGVGLVSVSGCVAPSLESFGIGDPVPDPFTQSAYTASYVSEGRWRMDGHDRGRTGRTSSAVPQGDVDVAWLRRPDGDPSDATVPVVGPERVYIGYSRSPDDSDRIEAHVAGFDAEDGSQQVDVHLGAGRVAGLALADDRLITMTRGPDCERTTLTALTRGDGGTQWTDTIPDVTGPPATIDDGFYLATRDDDNAVYRYGLDGTQQWRTPIGGKCYTATCADGERVYVGLTDSRIVALEAESGTKQWTEPTVTSRECCPDIQGTPAVADGRLYVPGLNEQLAAVDANTGSVEWTTTIVEDDHSNLMPSPAVTDDTVYVNREYAGLVALAAADGVTKWRSDEGGGLQPPAVGDGGVIVPRRDSVAAYDGAGSPLWTIDITIPDTGMGGYIMNTEVVLAHGQCYVGIADGRVYAIGSRD